MPIANYYDGLDLIPDNAFKISPSSVSKFFTEKATWYREKLLGEPKKFVGSTSTVLGTIVHHCCEITAKGEDRSSLDNDVETYMAKFDDDEYDKNKIRDLWRNMAESMIKEYVLGSNIVDTEQFILHELVPNVFVGGTYDAITSTIPNDSLTSPTGILTLRDYKTASKKPSTFTYSYKLQAYTYAYILHQKGIPISDVELCFAIQPTKTMGVRTERFIVPFDKSAYLFIEGILMLIAESVETWKEYPNCRYLLAADYRLKNT